MKLPLQPRTLQRILAALFGAFAIPFTVGSVMTMRTVTELMVHRNPEPLASTVPLPPKPSTEGLDPAKTVLILMSGLATETGELLSAYQAFKAFGQKSEKFHVFTVAPMRTLLPTTAGLTVIPDLELKDAPPAEIVVIPSVLDHTNADFYAWIHSRLSQVRIWFTLSEGVRLLTPQLDGLPATSNSVALSELKERHPQVQWKDLPRWVMTQSKSTHSATIISTGGGQSATEALQTLIPQIAQHGHTKNQLIPLPAPIPSRPQAELTFFDYLSLSFDAAFEWTPLRWGVVLSKGIDEFFLSNLLEVGARSLVARAYTLGEERVPLQTAHGLWVVPTRAYYEATLPHLLWYPSTKDKTQGPLPHLMKVWADTHHIPQSTTAHSPVSELTGFLTTSGYPRNARIVETLLELSPLQHSPPTSTRPKASRMVLFWSRPILLMLLGIWIALAIENNFYRRRSSAKPK